MLSLALWAGRRLSRTIAYDWFDCYKQLSTPCIGPQVC